MKTILLVDDKAIFREPIAASLRLAGYQTLCARDGHEGLAAARASRPDLILLDMSMPGMDGLRFLEHRRDDPTLQSIPVIMLTANSERQQVLAAATLGVREYLLKSRFRFADLMERMKKIEAAAGSHPPAAAAAAAAAATTTASATAARPPRSTVKTATAETAEAVSTASTHLPASIAATAEAAPPGMTVAAPAGDATTHDGIPRLLTREETLERIATVFKAKTLSGVVAQVIAMATSPRGEMSQLAGLIERDPMLAARVLQTANSAAYATGGAMATTVCAAIKKIGCNAVRNIAAALAVYDCMPEAGPDGFNPIRCWQHSFAVAQLCERFAAESMPERSGLAYLVGLCHDLGDIFVRTQLAAEHQRVVETAEQTGRSRAELHGIMLGVTPDQLVSAVLQCMAMPDGIRLPIERFHASDGPPQKDPIAGTLYLSEHCTNAAMLASAATSSVVPFAEATCRAAIGNANPPALASAPLRDEVIALTVSLAGLSRTEQKSLLTPMFAKRPGHVWVALGGGVASLDPIGLALGEMVDVTVKRTLPNDAELATIDGLVLLAASTTGVGFSQLEVDAVVTKIRAEGRAGGLLAISSVAMPSSVKPKAIPWQTATSLSALSAFVDGLSVAKPSRAAA